VLDERGQPVTDGVVVVSTFRAVAEGGLGAVDTTALRKVELKAGPALLREQSPSKPLRC
jgi:hypothetical protein